MAHPEFMTQTFLTAEWRYLAMLNYEIDPAILAPDVPPGTELDTWNGRSYVSVLGFLFMNTRVMGLSIPLHRDFEEVNLRFYVRRRGNQDWHHGVVFVRELVPKCAVALAANMLYGEKYLCLPMTHKIDTTPGADGQKTEVIYAWQYHRAPNRISMTVLGDAHDLPHSSEVEYLSERAWGYSIQRDHSTLEYPVDHSRWRIWDTGEAVLQCNVAELYGTRFVETLSRPPSSAILAEGSAVTVGKGLTLDQ